MKKSGFTVVEVALGIAPDAKVTPEVIYAKTINAYLEAKPHFSP